MAKVNCFAAWAEATLTPGVPLTTMPAASWYTIAYRVRPFQAERGDLAFALTFTGDASHWTARLTADGREEVQSYSPAQAASALLAAARIGPAAFGLFPP